MHHSFHAMFAVFATGAAILASIAGAHRMTIRPSD
jgi:hypothetical protein